MLLKQLITIFCEAVALIILFWLVLVLCALI